ncbi:MAG: SDR family oxidoreductase [Myxococcota bacterium]
MAGKGAYFAGKHVIITGGSSGIGLALAHQLAALRAKLSLVARREDMLEQARAAVKDAQPDTEVHVLPLDVASEGDVQARLPPHLEAHPVDMLINNAGIAKPGRFLEQEASDYREHMNINYFGMVHMTREVAPRLVERRSGHIANVGSLLSVMGIYGYSAYAASKFAMYGFSECLRAELRPFGVRLTMLLPPDTDTPQHTAELEIMPPETRAIAGNVKMLSAESVARSLLDGMAANRFEVIPGFDGRMTVMAQRWIPGVVHWVCDRAQRKVDRGSVESAHESA